LLGQVEPRLISGLFAAGRQERIVQSLDDLDFPGLKLRARQPAKSIDLCPIEWARAKARCATARVEAEENGPEVGQWCGKRWAGEFGFQFGAALFRPRASEEAFEMLAVGSAILFRPGKRKLDLRIAGQAAAEVFIKLRSSDRKSTHC